MPISRGPPSEIPPNRPGTLTPEQEWALKELWFRLAELTGTLPDAETLKSYGVHDDPAAIFESGGADDSASLHSTKKKRGKKGAEPDNIDKFGAKKEFKEALEKMTKQELHAALWNFSKADDPDSNMCRYLRARKWNVNDALVMLVSTIYWRSRVMKLDDHVMPAGELTAARAADGETDDIAGFSQKTAKDLLAQMRMGKSYAHGVDKQGQPISYVNVKLHKGGEYNNESLEWLTVYMIETCRFMLKPPQLETAVIVFDMTGFSLANMDYTPVKFIIKVFEANYPESLGTVLVHNAPWIFSSIWAVIKGWLDPVVAQKIKFTKSVKDLSEHIDLENIPKHMGGNEDWAYKYVEPVPGENDLMKDTVTRDRLLAERKKVVGEYEAATSEWILRSGQDDSSIKQRRKQLVKAMYDNYWQLDPYIRAKSFYDRIGVLRDGGEFVPYSTERPPSKPKAAAAKAGPSDGAAAGAGPQANGHAVNGAAPGPAQSPAQPRSNGIPRVPVGGGALAPETPSRAAPPVPKMPTGAPPPVPVANGYGHANGHSPSDSTASRTVPAINQPRTSTGGAPLCPHCHQPLPPQPSNNFAYANQAGQQGLAPSPHKPSDKPFSNYRRSNAASLRSSASAESLYYDAAGY